MMQTSLYQAQSQELRQEQILAPHQLQSLQMLTAPLLEVHTLINQELEVNPTLERLESSSEDLVGDPVEFLTAPAEGDDDTAASVAEKDEFLANLMQLDSSWRDGMGGQQMPRFTSPEDEERRQHFFDSLTTKVTLSDSLLEQLRASNDSEPIRILAEAIIGSISDSGYLRGQLAELAAIHGATMAEVEEALKLVQSFDPPGVGARDLRECLLLQLKRDGKQGSLIYQVVNKYLDKIAKNKIPEVARALKISPAVLYDVLYDIKRLQPRPGNAIDADNEIFVLPEIAIEAGENDSFVVSSNKDYVPRLRISRHYLKLLEDPATPSAVRSYIKTKITSSNLLLKSLAQRQSTITRIVERIVEHQGEFLRNGEEAMKPLTMSQVAAEIGVHETTVSRAVANKFVETPRGLLPLRQFFSSGFETEDGDQFASVSIRTKIQALISQEDPAHPLSDHQIVAALKEQGLNVARRTVAKYREGMGVLSSHQRKNHR